MIDDEAIDGFLAFMSSKHPTLAENILSEGKMTDTIKADLDAALAEYKEIFVA